MHRFSHVRVEFSFFSIHSLHVLLSVLDLPASAIYVLVVFLGVASMLLSFLAEVHALGSGFEEASEDVETMAYAGTAVLDGRYPRDIWMTLLLLFLLERQVLVQLSHVRDLLQLTRVALYLLFQVFNALGNTLCNL